MTEVGLETLQNWRLTEAEIDGFCHFWYDVIVAQHVRVKLIVLEYTIINRFYFGTHKGTSI